MKRLVLVGAVCLLVVGSGWVCPDIQAARLQRGPYLQIATPDSITIRWRTDVAGESVVNYGTSIGALTFSASDPNATSNHVVRLTGLSPSTQYFYSVGSSNEILAEGADCNFTTFPLPGPAQPTRVWVVGDPGQSWDLNQRFTRDAYTNYAGSRHTDVLLALGDNACTYNTDQEYQTFFFDVFAELLQQTAIWPTIGNHEIWSATTNGWFPYLDIFSLPTNGEAGGVASGTKAYYAFDYANIHFICLDSTTVSRATNGPMANWLRADLAAITNQWIIAYWHHPPYSFGFHSSDDPGEVEMTEMRRNILPILEAGGVDLVLNGHNHIYERSYLLHGHYGVSTTLQRGMILDRGSGRESETGAYLKPTSGPLANLGTVFVEVGCSASLADPGDISRHPVLFDQELQLGSLVLDINSNRLDAAFLRNTGVIGDSFTIIKQEPEPLRLDIAMRSGDVILSWKSVAGHRYRIEHSVSQQTPDWQSASDIITAAGTVTVWTNPRSTGPLYLYRVVEVPPEFALGAAGALKAGYISLAGWGAKIRSLLAPQDTSLPGQMPMGKKPKPPLTGAWASEAVVCNTTYWKRRIKPQPQQSGPRWRLASAPYKGIWRQPTLHG